MVGHAHLGKLVVVEDPPELQREAVGGVVVAPEPVSGQADVEDILDDGRRQLRVKIAPDLAEDSVSCFGRPAATISDGAEDGVDGEPSCCLARQTNQ